MSNLSIDQSFSRPASLLRFALLADAVASGATGLLALLGAGVLTSYLGVPAVLLREVGFILVPYAAFVAVIGTRASLAPPAVWVIIGCNALWAAGSIVLLAEAWIVPTLLGAAFILGQASAVALFGALQYVGLRRLVSA
jgi:hypothetical protein